MLSKYIADRFFSYFCSRGDVPLNRVPHNCTVVAADYNALYDLYYATNGPEWQWREPGRMQWVFNNVSDPCVDDWQGITCLCSNTSNHGYVSRLNLTSYNLDGTLPDSIGSFEGIQVMIIARNRFLARTIPESTGNLTMLSTLVLQENSLTGTLPVSLAQLTSLGVLGLKNNSLGGPIPAEYGALTQLTLFDVYLNQLTGTIPATFAQLSRIQYLDLYQNKLTGTIPSFLGSLQYLAYLYLGENLLVGTVPDSIGSLPRLISFYVNTNSLEGTIPRSLYNLARLEFLFLYENRFTGSLQGVFNPAAQKGLNIVLLHRNRFTGQLPEELFNIKSLTVVDGSSNCFEGTIPASVCNSTALQTLALDGMCGAESCRVKLLPGLGLNTYRLKDTLQGNLPECVYALPQLATLHVSGNGMPGQLPADLRVGPRLRDLALSHNKLSGSLPSAIQRRAWSAVDLSNNRITGTLSSDFELQPPSANLKLANNRLSGIIPQSILDSLSSISILDGNLFSCDYRKSNLPEQDTKLPTYQCGSNTFNVSYYFWLGASFTLGVAILVYTALRKEGGITVWSALMDAFHSTRAELNVFDYVDADGEPAKKKLRRFHKICAMCKLFIRLSFGVCVFIVVVLLPVYVGLAAKYSTLSQQYAYEASFIFMSGPVATAVVMVLMVLLTTCTFLWFTVLLRRYQRDCVQFEKEIEYDPLVVSGGRESYSRRELRVTSEKVTVYAGLVVVNVAVVVGANVAFMYAVLYGNESLLPVAQAALSVFKIFWSDICSRTVYYFAVYANLNSLNLRRAVFSWLIVLTLFNNVVVPCLVVMGVSTTCFYNVAEEGAYITSSYSYEECLSYRVGGCYEYTPITNTSSFRPPFVYSYQCAATFITSYAPSFIYLCIISGFIIPALRYCGYWLVRKLPADSPLIRYIPLPQILKPVPVDVSLLQTRVPLFDARRLLVTVMNYLGVLLTFGVIFPPLAVAVTITTLSTVFYARLEVKRFLSEAAAAQRFAFFEVIDADCFGIGSDKMLLRAVRVLIALSHAFYALFLFDTLGDAVGLKKAYWVLIVMPLLPFALQYLFYLYSGPVFVRQRQQVLQTLGALLRSPLHPPARKGQAAESPAGVSVMMSEISAGQAGRADEEAGPAQG